MSLFKRTPTIDIAEEDLVDPVKPEAVPERVPADLAPFWAEAVPNLSGIDFEAKRLAERHVYQGMVAAHHASFVARGLEARGEPYRPPRLDYRDTVNHTEIELIERPAYWLEEARFQRRLEAAEQLRDERSRNANAEAERAQWESAHRCTICSTVTDDVTARMWNTPATILDARACAACAEVVEHESRQLLLESELEDGRTRRDAVRAFLGH